MSTVTGAQPAESETPSYVRWTEDKKKDRFLDFIYEQRDTFHDILHKFERFKQRQSRSQSSCRKHLFYFGKATEQFCCKKPFKNIWNITATTLSSVFVEILKDKRYHFHKVRRGMAF